jgi:hypothetical protein
VGRAIPQWRLPSIAAKVSAGRIGAAESDDKTTATSHATS